MSADYLEHYTSLSIRKALEDASLSTVLQIQGHTAPVDETVEEWLYFELMSFPKKRGRKGAWLGSVMFQVTSLSRKANQRGDHEVNAPWILASEVRDVLEGLDLPIKQYDESAQTTVAVLQIAEGQSVYENGVGTDAGSGVHSVVTTFTGTLTKL